MMLMICGDLMKLDCPLIVRAPPPEKIVTGPRTHIQHD